MKQIGIALVLILLCGCSYFSTDTSPAEVNKKPEQDTERNSLELGELRAGQLSNIAKQLIMSGENQEAIPYLQEYLRRIDPVIDAISEDFIEEINHAKKVLEIISTNPKEPVDINEYGDFFTIHPEQLM